MSDTMPTGGSMESLSPDAAGGRRRMRKVSAKVIRRTLRRAGIKPKSRVVLKGGEAPPPLGSSGSPSTSLSPDAVAGRRRRSRRGTRRGRKSRRSLFGMIKY